MKVFGYQKDNDNLLELEEMSIQCSIEELDKIIHFMQDAKNAHNKVAGKTEMCHSHLQDWDKEWEKGEPDMIIVTTFPI